MINAVNHDPGSYDYTPWSLRLSGHKPWSSTLVSRYSPRTYNARPTGCCGACSCLSHAAAWARVVTMLLSRWLVLYRCGAHALIDRILVFSLCFSLCYLPEFAHVCPVDTV